MATAGKGYMEPRELMKPVVYTTPREFLNELADLLDKHHVALCSGVSGDRDYSYVLFQQYTDKTIVEFTNNRQHSTGHEFTCRLNSILSHLESKPINHGKTWPNL